LCTFTHRPPRRQTTTKKERPLTMKAKTTQSAPEGTHDNPIRYERLEKSDPDYRAKMKAQLNKFETDAKAGKVLCLSDLMCSAGM